MSRTSKREQTAVRSPSSTAQAGASPVRLGLRANWEQFALLVAVNAFVGAMVGVERVLLPLLAEREFALASRAAILSFIMSFGVVKAIANLFAGRISERCSRNNTVMARSLFVVVVLAIIPLAATWRMVVLANMQAGKK